MALENKLNIIDSTELARMEEKISKKKAVELFDIEIKYILKQALTDKINDREVYMKGIDHSYYYEGYSIYRAEDL